MKRFAHLLMLAIGAVAVTGCVERRYVITTDPPGALVLRSGQPIGAAPADEHFDYYGKYQFTLIADGYETQQVEQIIPTPWYEYFPLDFISENLVPWTIVDRREFHYRLEPRHIVNPNDLLRDAQNLRNRGVGLGAGSAQLVPPPPVVTTPAQ